MGRPRVTVIVVVGRGRWPRPYSYQTNVASTT